MAEPQLRVYARETLIAEKLQAMVFWGSINTRLKDFYDIWLLSREDRFRGHVLVDAIVSTFTFRNTAIPEEIPDSLSNGSASQLQQQWSAFLRRFNEEADEMADFIKIIEELRRFLDPVLLAASNSRDFNKIWKPREGWK